MGTYHAQVHLVVLCQAVFHVVEDVRMVTYFAQLHDYVLHALISRLYYVFRGMANMVSGAANHSIKD